MLFDRFVTARTEKRGKTRAVTFATSVAIHAAAGVALLVWSFWKIEKVQAKSIVVTFIEVAPPPPPPAAPPAPPAPPEATHKPRVAVIHETVQPVRPVDNHLQIEPPAGSGDPASTGTDANGVAGGTGVPGGTGPVADTPPAPPPPPTIVAESVIGAARIAGVREIPLPRAAKMALVAQHRRTTLATVKLCLDTAGVPSRIDIVASTGFADADDEIKAQMSAWRYRPYRVNGLAVPVCTSVVFKYQIDD